jgi:hypothetical protein
MSTLIGKVNALEAIQGLVGKFVTNLTSNTVSLRIINLTRGRFTYQGVVIVVRLLLRWIVRSISIRKPLLNLLVIESKLWFGFVIVRLLGVKCNSLGFKWSIIIFQKLRVVEKFLLKSL